jgi:hypothetical protein
MSIDFRSNQIRVNKLIASGSTGTQAKILIYPVDVSTNLSGGIDISKFNTSSIGSDVFLYVSGAINTLGLPENGGVVFGGDVKFSGSINVSSYASFDNNIFVNSDLNVFGLSKFQHSIFNQNIYSFATASFYGPIYGSSELTIDGLSTLNETVISGNLIVFSGLSGSLQSLSDGTPYLIGQGNTSIFTQSNGSIIISSSGGETLPSASNGAVLAYSSGAWSATDVGIFGQPLISSGSGKAFFSDRVVPLRIGTDADIPSDAALAIGWNYSSIVVRNSGDTDWLNIWKNVGGTWVYGTDDVVYSSGMILQIPSNGQFYILKGSYSHLFIQSDGTTTFGTDIFPTILKGYPITIGTTSTVTEYKGGAKIPEFTTNTTIYLGNSDEVVFFDTTTSAITGTLPPGESGRIITVQKITGSNNYVIVPFGSDTIRIAGSGSITSWTITDTFRHSLIYRSAGSEWVVEY